MRRDAIAGSAEALHDIAFEIGLRTIFLFFEETHEARGIFGVLDELAAEIVGLQVVVWAQGVNNPHLVARTAGGNIETLLKEFLIAEGKRAAFGSIDKRNKNDVALIALELCGVSAKYAVELVAIRRNTRANQVVDFDGLLVANERDDPETHRLACIILLVFGLLHGRSEKRSHSE